MSNRTQIRFAQISGSLPTNSANAFEIKYAAPGEEPDRSLMKFVTTDNEASVQFGSDISAGAGFGMSPGDPAGWTRITKLQGRGDASDESPLTGSLNTLDATLVTAAAVKTYVDAQLTAQDLDFVTDSGSGGTVDLDSQGLSVLGGEGMNVTHAGQTITVAGEEATSSNKGVASFASTDFDVASGAVSIKDASITNALMVDNAINTDEIVDNAVSLAKMAGIARGGIISGDSDGNPAALVVGSAHKFLQSDGTDLAYVAMSGDATLAAGILTLGSGSVNFGNLATDGWKDEDNMVSDSATHLATQQSIKAYADAVGAAQLSLAGGTMTGAIATNSTFDGVDIAVRDAILSSTTVTADAALSRAGGTMTGAMLLSSPTPASANSPASKSYVDALKQGLSVKDSVRLASTANIADLTAGADAGATIDGIVLVVDDRILLKDQTAGEDNGIYTVNADGNAPTRAVDADANAELSGGAFFFVEKGTTNADAGFVLTTDVDIIIGTTSMAFSQFSGAGAIVGGYGLAKSANTLALDLNELTAATIASGDFVSIVDITDSSTKKEEIDDIATLFAGAGLTASSAVMAVGGTADRISVAADSIDIASSYVGQSTITTVGTIGTGLWEGTAIGISKGGTGEIAKTAAFDALSPVTTRGDLIRMGASDNERFALGASGSILMSNGTDVLWGATNLASAAAIDGILPADHGGTGAAALDNIVIAANIGAITVSNGADSVIGGNVTLSVSEDIEALHDQCAGFAPGNNMTGKLMLTTGGGGDLTIVAVRTSRIVYNISSVVTSLDLTHASGMDSSLSGNDSNSGWLVYVNGQLLREGTRQAGGSYVVASSGDYVFHDESASPAAGSKLKFDFNLESGDIVQVVAQAI